MNKIKYLGSHFEIDGPHKRVVDQDDVLIYVGCAFALGVLLGILGCGF
jgi:hypothetical protein